MKNVTVSFSRLVIYVAACCWAERHFLEYSSQGNSTDCKWTLEGTDYSGNQSVTFAGEKCRFWTNSKYSDDVFPEGSRAAARNYCRNPSNRENGPWCYPVGSLEPEYCDIRLCSIEKCRRTGSGAEYTGEIDHSTSGSKCLKWSTILKHKKSSSSHLKKFPDEAFPELSRKWARNFCRNPNSNNGGPWCYVQSETTVHREYCDVPFCHEPGKLVTTFVTPNESDTFLQLPASDFQLSLSARLWDPRSWNRDIRISVSCVALPMTGLELWSSGLGFEVVFTPFRAFFTGYRSVVKTVPFSGTQWTNITLQWKAHNIQVYRDEKPLFALTFRSKVPMTYVALSGEGVVWDVAGTDGTDFVTSSDSPRIMWPMLRSPTGYHIDVWLRSRGGACVNIRETPTVRFPLLKVCFDDFNSTAVYYQEEENEPVTLLRKESSLGVVSWWEWRLVSVSIHDDGLLTASRLLTGVGAGTGSVTLLRLRTPIVRRLRWFGFSMLRKTVGHWSLSERPKDDGQTQRAVLPECVETKNVVESYNGLQWTTRSGRACRLWSNTKISGHFVDGSAEAALNYCRNPTADPQGPYCIIDDHDREQCDVRECLTPNCRRAGIATDYAGRLAVTRSNRTCRSWVDAATSALRNDSLYPERSVSSAENFCRDPSKSPSGPWCYTTDPEAPVDLCSVPDCDMPEDCIVLTHGMSDDRDMFILPSWKSQDGLGLRVALKQWDPTFTDGITFDLKPLNKSIYERITFGDYGGQSIKYQRIDESGKSIFLKEKYSPNPILIGKWTTFWLRFSEHQLEFGVEASSVPVTTFPLTGEAMFLDYYAAHGHYIGTSFPCNECHVERTRTPRFGRIMPLTFRGVAPPLRIWLRGSGVANVVVVKLPREEATIGFSIGIKSTIIQLLQDAVPYSKVLAQANTSSDLILKDRWTEFRFRLEERLVQVERTNQVILEYRPPKPFLVYFFAIAASQGSIEWAANCEPPEVDLEAPRHGGWSSWSPWVCSVTCGGGRGTRKRSCTAPPPSLTGRVCKGPALEDGPCNEFPCGVISPTTMTKLRADLQLRTESVSVEVGCEAHISCKGNAVDLLRQETPAVLDAIVWTHNALRVSENARVRLTNEQILLTNTSLSDAGVYVCQVEQGDQRLALRIFVLSVTSSEPTLMLRTGVTKTLRCGALELGLFFSSLRVRWLHDRFLLGERALGKVEDDNILVTGKEGVDGVWECQVFSVDLNVSWRTAWNRILILPAPSFLTHLMEDRATKWLFQWTKTEQKATFFLFALIGGVAFSVCSSVVVVVMYSR